VTVKWFRRADHSMIFLLIAGTYTPICLVALPPAWGIPLLVVGWGAALTGVALWVVTLVVPGIAFVGGDSTAARVGIIFVVAVIFGLINAVIKPVVQIISIPLYILTLGLIHIVINALMLWITSSITEHTTHWGLFIDDFWWTAIWAAIVLSVVSWLLSLIVRAD
jgi:putative membrane protein